MNKADITFVQPVSILPALVVFNILFLILNLLFRTLTMVIDISNAFVLPIIMVSLLISCFYAVQFFIKKHRRYFMLSELLFIVIASIISVWILHTVLDGMILLQQSFFEALINSAISMLFQSIPITIAYTYLGRYMLTRFLANQTNTDARDR